MATTNDETLGEKLREFQRSCVFPTKTYVRKILLNFIAAGTLLHFPLSGVGRVSYYGMKFIMGFPNSILPQERKGLRPHGLDLRLSNAQAAIGLSQLQQLPHNIAHRLEVARIYEDELTRAGWPVVFPTKTAKTQVVFLRYPIWIDDNRTVLQRRRLGLEIGNWFDTPIYMCDNDCWDAVRYQAGSCLVAEDTIHRVINLPTHIKVTSPAARATIKEVIDRYATSNGL